MRAVSQHMRTVEKQAHLRAGLSSLLSGGKNEFGTRRDRGAIASDLCFSINKMDVAKASKGILK